MDLLKQQLKLINANLPLLDQEKLCTLTIENGLWTSITKQKGYVKEGQANDLENMDEATVLNLEGKILLPGLVDAHMHLDKAFSLQKVGNSSGTLEEAVENYSYAVKDFSKQEIKSRIIRAALMAVSFGTTAIRTHLDFHIRWGKEVAFRTIEAAIEAKNELKTIVDIQLFPLTPFFHFTEEEINILEEAMQMGLTGFGGAPHLSQTPEKDIDIIFRLAEKYDCPIDFHTDESDDPNVRTVNHIAKRTIDYGMKGRVTVDHLCSLAAMSIEDAEKMINKMIEAGLKAVTLPGANLYLQGRHDSFPVRRGVTRVKELLSKGVPIATASDNIHDPFHPFGRGDLLQIGLITAYATHMGSPTDIRTILKMITEIPANILRLNGYGISVGNKANFVIFDAITPEELFTLLPERRWIYRNGGWLIVPGKQKSWNNPKIERLWSQSKSYMTLTL